MNQNKNIFLTLAVIVIFLGAVIWFSNPTTRGNNLANVGSTSSGVLTAEETAFDFGTVSMSRGNVSHIFNLKNDGPEPVTITKMYTSCMCTTASLIKGNPLTSSGYKKFGPFGMPGHGLMPKLDQMIESGEEAAVEVVFDPTAHGPAGVGRIDRIVYLENNAGEPLELSFTAMVTP